MDAHEPCVPVDDAPRVDRQSQACAGDLAITRPTTKLRGQLDHLGQAGGAERVPAPDEATARVHDETGGVDAGGARLGRRPGLARTEETERLEGVELLGGRGVVQLDHIGIARAEPERFPGCLGGLGQPVVVVD